MLFFHWLLWSIKSIKNNNTKGKTGASQERYLKKDSWEKILRMEQIKILTLFTLGIVYMSFLLYYHYYYF